MIRYPSGFSRRRRTGRATLSTRGGVPVLNVALPVQRLLQAPEDGEGHVEHRNATAGGPLQGPPVRVSVDRYVRAQLVDGAGQPGGPEKGEDLQRFALQRLPA